MGICCCCCLVTQSCSTLWTLQAPLSMGISRQEYWSRLPFPSPGDLPNPGIKSMSPTSLLLCRQILYLWATSEAPLSWFKTKQNKTKNRWGLYKRKYKKISNIPDKHGCKTILNKLLASQIQQHIERTMYHDQAEFTPRDARISTSINQSVWVFFKWSVHGWYTF